MALKITISIICFLLVLSVISLFVIKTIFWKFLKSEISLKQNFNEIKLKINLNDWDYLIKKNIPLEAKNLINKNSVTLKAIDSALQNTNENLINLTICINNYEFRNAALLVNQITTDLEKINKSIDSLALMCDQYIARQNTRFYQEAILTQLNNVVDKKLLNEFNLKLPKWDGVETFKYWYEVILILRIIKPLINNQNQISLYMKIVKAIKNHSDTSDLLKDLLNNIEFELQQNFKNKQNSNDSNIRLIKKHEQQKIEQLIKIINNIKAPNTSFYLYKIKVKSTLRNLSKELKKLNINNFQTIINSTNHEIAQDLELMVNTYKNIKQSNLNQLQAKVNKKNLGSDPFHKLLLIYENHLYQNFAYNIISFTINHSTSHFQDLYLKKEYQKIIKEFIKNYQN